MKSIHVLVPALVLTASLLTGCGCRNSKPVTEPTTAPTTATVLPTTAPTEARPTVSTLPTTDGAVTDPSADVTLPDGNGPLSTDETTIETGTPSRSRSFGME